MARVSPGKSINQATSEVSRLFSHDPDIPTGEGNRSSRCSKAAKWCVTGRYLSGQASRTYSHEPPKRESTQRFRFYTWFNRFSVPDEADFFLLVGMYAPDAARTKPVGPHWYKDCTLLFTLKEMQ